MKSHSALPLHQLLIFITGAVILALQLLASRIMTPYFGVSLYIWTGILAITLTCLAIGYFVGGRWTRTAPADASRIEYLFVLMPAVSSVAVAVAALAYPAIFRRLAEASLVGGSFLACAVLLAVPLVAMSAMNPLLVALRRAGAATEGGDGDSGWVFFVSTIGSVAGVALAAFVLIPNLTNFRSVVLLGAVLGVAAVAGVMGSRTLRPAARRIVWATALGGAGMGSALFILADSYVGWNATVRFADIQWSLVEQYPTAFGNLKVVDYSPPRQGMIDLKQLGQRPRPKFRAMIQDGVLQNIVEADGRSATMFSYALEMLARSTRPDARKALVLGLGVGIVPTALARRGIAVDVVDINPVLLDVAQRHFGFVPGGMRIHWADARTFIRSCQPDYDVVIVDLFFGDGTPDHLLSREFFADLGRCAKEDAVVLMNTLRVAAESQPHDMMLAALTRTFPSVLVFHANEPLENAYVAASRGEIRFSNVDPFGVPPSYERTVRDILAKGRGPVDTAEFATDESNLFLLRNAAAQVAIRKSSLSQLPDICLVN